MPIENLKRGLCEKTPFLLSFAQVNNLLYFT